MVSIDRPFLKGLCTDFFSKNLRAPAPILCETFKVTAILVQLLTIRSPIANGAGKINCTIGVGKHSVLVLVAMAVAKSTELYCGFSYRKITFWARIVHCDIGRLGGTTCHLQLS